MTAFSKTHSSCGSKPPMSNKIIRSGRRPKFLRSACPQLGAADAPTRDHCPLVYLFAATGSVFVELAFLFSGAIELADASRLQVFLLGCRQLRADDVRPQLLRIIIHTALENSIKYPNQLTACCDDGLLALERILFPGSEVLIHFPELGIVLNHG